MTYNDIKIPEASSQNNVWLRVGCMINGWSAPVKNAHIIYNADEILYADTEFPSKKFIKPGQQNPDAELPRATILPGLIEAHAHLFLEGGELGFNERKVYLAKAQDELLELAENRLEKLIRTGIIAVRDAGDKDGVGLALSRIYDSTKKPLMPYVDSPGAAINHKGFYGGFMSDPIENHSTLKGVVISRINGGADRIKLIPTGIINFKEGAVTKKPQMTLDEVKTLVSAAHELGKQTFAHASGADGIEHAIEGGVDSVEHGFFIREDQLAKMRDRDIAWVPTFTPVQLQVDYKDIMKWDDQTVGNLQKILDCHSASLRKAHELGVKIIAGSDAGSYGVAHGKGFLYELELMEKSGLPPLTVINSATGMSSSRFAYKENFGMIKPGYKARFIITEYDPLKTVSNLKKDKRVIFDGLVYEAKEEMDYSGM